MQAGVLRKTKRSIMNIGQQTSSEAIYILLLFSNVFVMVSLTLYSKLVSFATELSIRHLVAGQLHKYTCTLIWNKYMVCGTMFLLWDC